MEKQHSRTRQKYIQDGRKDRGRTFLYKVVKLVSMAKFFEKYNIKCLNGFLFSSRIESKDTTKDVVEPAGKDGVF